MSLNRNPQKKVTLAPNAKREPQPSKAHLPKLPTRMLKGALSGFLDNCSEAVLSNSCVTLYTTFEEDLEKRALKRLLKALAHHDKETVISILKCKPYFLSVKPADFGIKEIQSDQTFLRFETEEIFIMVQKWKRLAMTRTLFPLFENLAKLGKVEKGDKADRKGEPSEPEVARQWIIKPFDEVKYEIESKALREKYISDHFLRVITVLSEDMTIQVTWGENNETGLYEANVLNASPKTEFEFNFFRQTVSPDEAIPCDKYDFMQMLVALNEAYIRHFDEAAYDRHYGNSPDKVKIYFKNWHQRDAYAVCIMGFVKSLLDPEQAEKYCEDFEGVVQNGKPISARARQLLLPDGQPYYRSSRGSHRGQGFNFQCSEFGGLPEAVVGWARWGVARHLSCRLLQHSVKQTQQSLALLPDEFSAVPKKQVQLNTRGA